MCGITVIAILAVVALSAPIHAQQIVGVNLTPPPSAVPSPTNFPFLANVVTPDPNLLDAFARQYASQTSTPDIQDFFLWWLPNQLFNINYGLALPPPGTNLQLSTPDGAKRALWLTLVTGWELGIFARWTDGPNFRPVGTPVTNDALATDLAYMVQAQQAAFASASDVLAFNLASLRVGGGPPPIQSEDGWYGYDAQYLKEITTVNLPTGVAPIPNYITYTSGTLDATYQIGDAPFLAAARVLYNIVLPALGGGSNSAIQQRLNYALNTPSSLASYQQGFEALGHEVWGVQAIGIFQNTPYNEFVKILTLSAYFVQYSQTDTMMALSAYALQNAFLGRAQAMAVALFRCYVELYVLGLIDPNSTEHFPSLTAAFAQFRTAP